MTITIDRQVIEEALYEVGLDDDDLRTDYSGRSMYGDSCFGIVCDIGELLMFAAVLGERGDSDWIGGVRSDSMGRSTIWYWPSVTLAEES